jgi:hypothetical protein
MSRSQGSAFEISIVLAAGEASNRAIEALSRFQGLRVRRRSRPWKGLAMSSFQPTGLPAWSRSFSAPATATAAALKPVRALLRRPPGQGAKAVEMGFCCRARLALARREWVVLSRVRHQTLVCEAGELWVTLDGDGEDHLLRAGERLAVVSNASVIVSATREAVLRVVASTYERCAGGGPVASAPAAGQA